MNTIKLYWVNTYQAYQSSECGTRWYREQPTDTRYYKHEIINEQNFILPAGVTEDDVINVITETGNPSPVIETIDNVYALEACSRFIVQDRETGTTIIECDMLQDALATVEEFERVDKSEGSYKPDCYEVRLPDNTDNASERIGRELAKLRKAQGITQSQMADLLNTFQSNIARIEAGKDNISINQYADIANALGKRLELV